MKVSKMRECLNGYRGGFGRMLKQEPHIKALENFDKTIKLEGCEDRELSLKELCTLIEIIIGKNDRDGTKESSKCFKQLTDALGGKSVLLALECLHKNKVLKEAYVEAIFRFASDLSNHKYLGDLSIFIVLLSGNLAFADNSIPAVLKDLQKIDTLSTTCEYLNKLIKNKLLYKYVLLFILNTNETYLADEIIHLLAKKDLLNESIIEALPKTELGYMNSVLSLLEQTDPALLTQENLVSICSLSKNVSNFYDIIDYLARLNHLNQNVLGRLLNRSAKLDLIQATNLIEIFKNVTRISPQLEKYLDVILDNAEQSITIRIATDKLREHNLPLPIAQNVLDALFANLQFHVNLLAGIGLLVNECRAALNSEYLQRILDQPEYAESLAKAIVVIKSMNTENQKMIDSIFQIPSHAGAIATSFKILVENNNYNVETVRSIMNEHENGEKVTLILELLRKNSICNNSNIIHFHEKKLTCQEAVNVMSLLDSKALLNQPNFDRLLNYARYVKTIASAAACLANGDKLTQENFVKLLADPPHAHNIARKLGGKPHPTGAPERVNAGVNRYFAIRDMATIIAMGQRQHAFFPQKIDSYNQELARGEQLKASGRKKPLRNHDRPKKNQYQTKNEMQIQNEIWKKIYKLAHQDKNASLDPGVEDTLFNEIFSATFSRKK